MGYLEVWISTFVVLWAVIDPIGTIPVYLAVSKNYSDTERSHMAAYSSWVAFGVLMFFMIAGEVVLKQVGVSLAAFQISGGIILFLFALDMIFGSSKPENEMKLVTKSKETAIFPLAIPSIAGPGSILTVVLLTDNASQNFMSQARTALILGLVVFLNYLMMRQSEFIQRRIGNSGAIIISKVMGLILASMAANNTLIGIKAFFSIA